MSEIGKKIIAGVRAAAEARPDHKYVPPLSGGRCAYVFCGQPSCIVGQALWATGLIDASLERRDCNIRGLRALRSEIGLDLDESELDWLHWVQDAQDRGKPWAYAVRVADERAA